MDNNGIGLTGSAATLAGLGIAGGYNRGTEVSNGFLGLQNSAIRGDVKENACAIAKSELGVVSAIQNSLALSEIRSEGRLTAIQTQVAGLEKSFYERELAKSDRDAILAGQTTQRLQTEVNAFCCPKPSAIYNPITCSTFPTQG